MIQSIIQLTIILYLWPYQTAPTLSNKPNESSWEQTQNTNFNQTKKTVAFNDVMLDHLILMWRQWIKNISYQSFCSDIPRKKAALEHSIKTTLKKYPQIELLNRLKVDFLLGKNLKFLFQIIENWTVFCCCCVVVVGGIEKLKRQIKYNKNF